MNSAIVVAFAAVLAIANAGYLTAAPAVYTSQLSSQAGYGVSHSTGIVRGAPLIGAYAAPLAYAAPAVHAAPLDYSTSVLSGNGYPSVYGGAAHIRVARGIYSGAHVAAPLTTYAAAPIAHSAQIAYAAPALRSVAYSAPIAHAAPIAYAAHSAPLAYAGAPAVYGNGYGIHGVRAFL